MNTSSPEQLGAVRVQLPRAEIPKAFEELFKPAPYKAYYGGRGGAKTESFCTATLIESMRQPLNILCCREVQRSIRDSVKAMLDAKIVNLGLVNRFSSFATEITNDVGSRFIFSGLRGAATTVRSLANIHLAWVEEANAISQSSLDTLMPTIRTPWPDGRSPEIWFCWNPRMPKDPVDAMFRNNPPPDAIIRRVNYRDNPFFPDNLRKQMEWDQRRDAARYGHIWLGEYASISEAQVFKNWSIGVLAVPPDARPYYGADWGFAIDPTVLVRCYVLLNTRQLYIDACVSQVGCEIDRTPALFDKLDEGQARKWPIKADSSRPETIDYMHRHGYPHIVGARKGPGSVEEGIEFLKTFDIVVNPNCRNVIDELTLYSFETDKITNEVLPKLADKDNHTIDALRYAVEGLRHGMETNTTVGPIIVSSKRTYLGDHPGW